MKGAQKAQRTKESNEKKPLERQQRRKSARQDAELEVQLKVKKEKAKPQTDFSFFKLPHDVILLVISRLESPLQLANVIRSNRELRDLCHENEAWLWKSVWYNANGIFLHRLVGYVEPPHDTYYRDRFLSASLYFNRGMFRPKSRFVLDRKARVFQQFAHELRVVDGYVFLKQRCFYHPEGGFLTEDQRNTVLHYGGSSPVDGKHLEGLEYDDSLHLFDCQGRPINSLHDLKLQQIIAAPFISRTASYVQSEDNNLYLVDLLNGVDEEKNLIKFIRRVELEQEFLIVDRWHSPPKIAMFSYILGDDVVPHQFVAWCPETGETLCQVIIDEGCDSSALMDFNLQRLLYYTINEESEYMIFYVEVDRDVHHSLVLQGDFTPAIGFVDYDKVLLFDEIHSTLGMWTPSTGEWVLLWGDLASDRASPFADNFELHFHGNGNCCCLVGVDSIALIENDCGSPKYLTVKEIRPEEAMVEHVEADPSILMISFNDTMICVDSRNATLLWTKPLRTTSHIVMFASSLSMLTVVMNNGNGLVVQTYGLEEGSVTGHRRRREDPGRRHDGRGRYNLRRLAPPKKT